MQQRTDSFRGPDLLCDGEGPAFFYICGYGEPPPRSRSSTRCSVRVGGCALPFGNLQPVARLPDFRGDDFLHSHLVGTLSAALESAEFDASVSCSWIPLSARFVHPNGCFSRNSAVEVQTTVHLAGADYRFVGVAGLLHLELGGKTRGESVAGRQRGKWRICRRSTLRRENKAWQIRCLPQSRWT